MKQVTHEYPSVFKKIKEIIVRSPAEINKVDPINGPRTLAYSWTFDDTHPRATYINQKRFADSKVTERMAQADAAGGWSVPGAGTAKGTFYHEFGHHVEREIIKDPRLSRELARELKKVGVSIDDGLGFPQAGRSVEGVLSSGLSRYGASKPSEMIAEAFAEWKLSASPRPIASVIGRFIDKHFKGME